MSRSPARLQILFLLAGSEQRRARLGELTREYLERADYDLLARDLAERRLLPLIGSRAVESAPDLVPDGFREAVRAARAAARARGLAVEAITTRLAASLGDAGIRALPLKGPLLATAAHGDFGLRETADVDLLVAPENLEAARDVLREQSYEREPADARRPNGLPDLHLELPHPALPTVELHWRAYWYESAFSQRMLAEAEAGDDGLLRAQPADLITSLLLFYARDGFHGVRIAADIAAWWDRHGGSLPPRFLQTYAGQFPELEPALLAAAMATERLTGVPATSWLEVPAEPGYRVGAAARLADWAQAGDLDQMSANISLVGALLRPPGSLPEFARRELVLDGKGPFASAVHTAKVTVRSGIALWKVRGSRAWVEPPAAASAAAGVQH